MDIFSPDGILLLLRWLHLLAGITWIGMLYYFNFVQTPFFKGADGAVRSGMILGLVPSALWWFRWGAMFTFLSGWAIVSIRASGIGYPLDGPYMTLILTGGFMGSLMWYNVWFIIWPAQKVVIASAENVAAGREAIPEAAAGGARAGMASRTNTLFSIPMLFFMGSAFHFQGLGGTGDVMLYWILVLVVVSLVEITGACNGAGKATQKHLTTVRGVITAGFVLTLVLYLLADMAL
jgi:uncharacterized membrane protein